METGTVKDWNDARAFGFIARPGKRDVFVHKTGLAVGLEQLVVGDKVEFDLEEDERGRLRATDVRLQGRDGHTDGAFLIARAALKTEGA